MLLFLLKHLDFLRLLKHEVEYPTPTLTSIATPMGHYVRKAARH